MKASVIVSSIFAFAASLVTAAPTENKVAKRTSHGYVYGPQIMIKVKESYPTTPHWDSDWGEISRTNGAHNVYTLLSIHIPHEAHGKTCKFQFVYPDYLAGSKSAQVFTLGGPVLEENTFYHRPHRDNHVATFHAVYDGHATFEHFGQKHFPCPAGETKHYELVPVGDHDTIEWSEPNGFQIVAFTE